MNIGANYKLTKWSKEIISLRRSNISRGNCRDNSIFIRFTRTGSMIATRPARKSQLMSRSISGPSKANWQLMVRVGACLRQGTSRRENLFWLRNHLLIQNLQKWTRKNWWILAFLVKSKSQKTIRMFKQFLTWSAKPDFRRDGWLKRCTTFMEETLEMSRLMISGCLMIALQLLKSLNRVVFSKRLMKWHLK